MSKNTPDKILLGITGAIIFFGLFVLASAASVGSDTRFAEQLLFGFLPGAAVAFAFFKIPLPVLQKWAPYLLLGNIILLLMVFVPAFSETARGATRWISLGFVSFQPAEFLKLTFILYMAGLLALRKERKKGRTGSLKETLLPFLVVTAVVGFLLIKQPDISTLGIIFFATLIIYFTARTPVWHTLALLAAGGITGFLVIHFTPYRLSRISGLFNPDLEPLGATYQLRQALITVGSGGIFGLGVGMSQQKFGFLPFPATDSIFAILAEETGFIGSVIIIFLFSAFLFRGFQIALASRSGFARLVAIGICSWIFIQATVNIGTMVGLFPVTGIPLPLISFGKSHLIAEMAAIGILLNISRYTKK